MRRVLLVCAAITFAIACTDNITEPTPDRPSATGGSASRMPTVAFATTTTEDGLSISTDKDDYAPGDTVHFTGSGWPSNDVLDIQLDDEPATHPAHTWAVSVGEDGTFQDSTYVVDVGDLGVTFTLTATSRATGRSLTVVFTDGQLRLPSPAVPAGLSSVPFSPGTLTLTAQNPTQGSPSGGHTNVRIRIRSPQTNLNQSPTLVKELTVTASLSEPNSASVSWDGTDASNAPVAEGLYMARVLSVQTAEDDNGNRKVPIVVDKTAPTISSVALSQTSITQGQSIAIVLTATATDPIAAAAAADHYRVASAQFNHDGGSFGSMTAQDGTFNGQIENLTTTIAAGTVAALSAGSHDFCVKATDAAGNASSDTGSCATLQVDPSAVGTTTEVVSSLNPSVFGQSVTFTATIKSGGEPVTAGSVKFIEEGTCAVPTTTHQAAAAVDGTGQASFSTATLSIGSHAIAACYIGTPAFTASDGSVVQQVKTNVTSTAVTSSSTANTSVFGESVTFTATVTTGSPAEAVAVGSIAFIEGGTCGSPGTTHQAATAVNGSGQASFTTSALSVATHNIVGCYSGSPGPYAASEGSVSQIVSRAVTTTSVSSSSAGNTSVFGEPVTFEATVAVSAPGSGTPTGTVTFIEGGTCAEPTTILSGPTALSTLKASFQTSLLSVTSHTIVGCYSGDGNFTDSNGSTTQTVNKALTTTTITSTSPSGSQFVNGQVTINFAVAVTAPGSGTPTGTVGVKNGSDVLCSAALPATSCQFTPTTVALLSLVASYSGDGNFFGSSSTPAVSYTVKYNLGTGLFAPVDRPNTLNVSKAGQAIPLKWRLTDAAGAPITNLTAVNVKASSLACIGGSTTDMIEEYASGSSGLQNLGDGYYQFNWKTPSSYATLCKSIALDFISYVEGPLANFQFKK
jgi:hypothetical protein